MVAVPPAPNPPESRAQRLAAKDESGGLPRGPAIRRVGRFEPLRSPGFMLKLRLNVAFSGEVDAGSPQKTRQTKTATAPRNPSPCFSVLPGARQAGREE